MKKGLTFLLLLHGILLWPVLSGNKAFFLRDTFHYFYPQKWQVIEEWKSGRIPLWDDTTFLGKTLIGDPPAGVFDPANLLYTFLPFDVGFHVCIALHILLFTAGIFLLVEALGASACGAFLAAFSLSFSPGFLFLTTHYSYFTAYCLIPWFGLCLLALLRTPTAAVSACFAAVVAMQFLKGEPQIVYLEGLGCIAVLLWAFFQKPRRKATLLYLAFTGLGFILLSACQWLPSLDFLHDSIRQNGLSSEVVLAGSFHPYRFLEYLRPYPWGNPLGGETYLPSFPTDTGFVTPWILSYYLGLPFLMGAFLLFPLKKKFSTSPTRAMFAVAAIFALLALGKYLPLLHRLPLLIPGWSLFRTPEKLMWFANIALACGLGLLWDGPKKMRQIKGVSAKTNKFIWLGFVGLQVIALFIILPYHRLFRERSFYRQPALVDLLQANPPPGRFYGMFDRESVKQHYLKNTEEQWQTLRPNVGTRFGVRYLDGYSSAVPASFVVLWQALAANPQAHMNLYNVRYMLAPRHKQLPFTDFREVPQGALPQLLTENPHALPPYFAVQAAQLPIIYGGEFTNIQNFLPSSATTIVEERASLRHVRVNHSSDQPAWLVWTENTDRHWRATRNGSAVEMQKIYPAVNVVELVAGANDVVFEYKPAYLPAALGISALGVALAIGSVTLVRRKKTV